MGHGGLKTKRSPSVMTIPGHGGGLRIQELQAMQLTRIACMGEFTEALRPSEIEKIICVAIPAEKKARARKTVRKTDIRISSL